MRVITWNTAARSSRLVEQATALAGREPDVVALQEVSGRTEGWWRAACGEIGLPHVRTSLEAPDSLGAFERRRTAVLVASREPLCAPSLALAVPWPETAVAAWTATPAGPVEIHCVHVPNAANGWVKPRTLEAIRGGLATAAPAARVLCGDLNIPRRELPDGRVLSFARDSSGRLRPERGAEWDEAELGVVPGLLELGYSDAFRALHGYGAREPSWTWQKIAGHGGGWRIDHLFTSPELRPVACRYHHAWRDDDLSDHAALEADLHHRTISPPSNTSPERAPR